MHPVIAAAGLITGAVAVTRLLVGGDSPAPAVSRDHVTYPPDDVAPYGPHHGHRRPRGLPTLVVVARGATGRLRVDGINAPRTRGQAIREYTARFGARPDAVDVIPVRTASARGAAVRPITEEAHRAQLGEAFVRTVAHLARTEGEGGTFAVPARNFAASCRNTLVDRRRRCTPVDAPRGDAALITAWGVFQWNRDAGRALRALDDLGLKAPPIPADWMPWDWSATDEIGIPIDYYARLWALVRRRGGTDRDAARGARLWHTGPNRFRRYLHRGADDRAWAAVRPVVARRIDRHLAHAGVA